MPAITKHLKVLENAGLISRKRQAQWRPCQIEPKGFEVASEWITKHQKLWNDRYVEIQPKTLIIMDHVSQPKFRITARFEPVGNRTWIYFSGVFESPSQFAAVQDFAILGNEGNFDRIEALLAQQTGSLAPIPFLLSRTFKTTTAHMWKMWTQPQHMAQWWGPKGVTVGYSQMDFTRGGTYHYCMKTPEGAEMWGKMYYRDIVPQIRLMFVNTFSDAQGAITRHPMSPQWPAELLSTITLEPVPEGVTLTIRWSPINATVEEIQYFNEGHNSMSQGWGENLDRLEAIL